MTQTNATISSSGREMSISRLINAPRELVFKVWTEPEHVAQWWGPNGFKNTVHEMNVKAGGVWRLTMHGPDGRDYPNKIVYKEVVKPERLVYQHMDDDGVEPVSFQVTVTFEEQGNKTLLNMKAVFASAAELERLVKEYGAKEGMSQNADRLEAYLANIPV
ncbi:MAG: SRPBCC family protein [Ferruginibacter sp.]